MLYNEYQHVHVLKRTIYAHFTSIRTFSGSNGLILFPFLSDLLEALKAYMVSEGAAVHTFASYFSDQARSMFESHVQLERSTQLTRLRVSWPYVVQALLERFITDEMLRDEHRVISDAQQRRNESVRTNAEGLEGTACSCCHVFHPTELIKKFALGLILRLVRSSKPTSTSCLHPRRWIYRRSNAWPNDSASQPPPWCTEPNRA